MTLNNNTQGANLEANPNGAENQPQNNEGNNTVVTPQPTEPKKEEGKTFSQQDLDNMAAKARGTAERETRRKILAELGLKDDEMDKLNAFKQAYEVLTNCGTNAGSKKLSTTHLCTILSIYFDFSIFLNFGSVT